MVGELENNFHDTSKESMSVVSTEKPLWALETTSPPPGPLKPVGEIAKTTGVDIVSTLQNSLVVVAGFSWVHALQSLFAADKGIFKRFSRWGPWIVAIVTTLLATFTTQLVARVLKIPVDTKKK
jgi:hypothetical protein